MCKSANAHGLRCGLEDDAMTSKASYLARMLAQRHPGDTSTPPLLAELLVAIAQLELEAEQAKQAPVVRRIDVLGPSNAKGLPR